MIQAAKLIGAGLATISGVVFGNLITAISRNPSIAKQLFVYAILGFTLFGLRM